MKMYNAIKLLAIDDKPDNLTALSAAVRDTLPQTIVLTATDGLAGFALAASEDPDVILLGIDMPGMDSFEVCRRLKADARLSEIPVVFVTERNTSTASRFKALEAGAEGFLTQPLEPAELTAQIRAIAKVKAANRSQRLEKERLESLVAECTQALHEGDERFRIAQEMSPDGFTILHPLRGKNGEIVDFTWVYENQAIARMNGTDPEEVKGKRLLDLFPMHKGTASWEAYTRVADTGQPQTIDEIYVGEITSGPTWLRLIAVSMGGDIAILAQDITARKQAEESLRESRDLLDATQRLARIGGWEWDVERQTMTWTEETYRIHGMVPGDPAAGSPEHIDRSLACYDPADRPIIDSAFRRCATTGQPYNLEFPITRTDGRRIWIQTVAYAVKEGDCVVKVVGNIKDITERKQAEEDLFQMAERYRLANKATNDVIWDWDVIQDTQRWNEAGTTVFGWTEIVERPVNAHWWVERVHPDDRKRVRDSFFAAVNNPQLDVWQEEYRFKKADGTDADVLDRGCVMRDEHGRAIRMIGAMQDITARKQAENTLRQSEERYQWALRAIDAGIWEWNLATDTMYLSPRWKGILGFDEHEFPDGVGELEKYLHPDDRDEMLAAMHDLTDGRTQHYDLEFRARHKDGAYRWIQSRALLVRAADGQPLRIVGSHTDITARKQAEEALRKSEGLFKKVFEILPIGLWIADKNGKLMRGNPAGVKIWGLEPKVGQSEYDVFKGRRLPSREEIAPEEWALAHTVNKGVTIVDELLEIDAFDGKRKTILNYTAPILDSNGGVEGAIVVNQDITARKRAEEALQESLAMLAQTEGIAHVGSWEWDIATDTVVWSDELFRIFQLDPGRGAPSFAEHPKLYLPEDMRRLQQAVETAVASGAPFELELRAIRTDGEICHCLARGRAEMGPEGRATRLFGSLQDITERKQMEEERARLSAEVRVQARQMAQILATVPAGVLLLDAAGRILQANTVAVGDLVVLAGVAVGDTLTRLGDRPLAELLATPPIRGVWHEVKADGRTFEVIARPVENAPESELWVLVINDVTREREIQAQLQQQAQLAVVGQLAAGIAHDFNNIMTVIVLYAEMGVSMADVPLQLRERLEIILQQANRATDLIQQILDFSRRAVLERRPLDLLCFLKETVKLLERTLPENIGIELAYAKDEYTVSADPTRMQQAIMNLATNARDAMLPQGGGELRITLSQMTGTDEIRCITCGQVFAGDQWVRITVTDSGCGIPPEALPHIFEPFFTTKEVGKGTGLGLAQVYGIVKQHEGHIDVVTEVGRGTTFNLYLLALPVQPSEAPAYEWQAAVQGQGEMVLLVEDNAVLREVLVDILEVLNYQALQAASGNEALAVLERRPDEIALVLSDLVMPEMGGQALLHAMRQRGLTQPVVILSGHPMESELDTLQAQGLAGWMLKPPSVKPLAQLLAQVLHKEFKPG